MKNTWNSEITLEAIESARRNFQDEAERSPASAVLSRFCDDFRISYIYNSNAIEGNPITEYDTAHIIRSGSFLETYTAKDNMEVLGSNQAWDYVLTQPKMSLETMVEIHKRILFFDVEHAGAFRKSPVHIGEKQMPSPEIIPNTVDALLASWPNQTKGFASVAEFHLRFENIHPFIDGNGRTGRMLLNLQLIQAGYLPINIKQNDAGKYYRCFRQYDRGREKGIQEMFNLITKYEYEELTQINQMLSANRP